MNYIRTEVHFLVPMCRFLLWPWRFLVSVSTQSSLFSLKPFYFISQILSIMMGILTNCWKLSPLWCHFHIGPLRQHTFHPHHVPLISMKCVSLSVWLALLGADRQTAGFSVNSMVSCALHTFGMKSPFNRHGSLRKAGRRTEDVLEATWGKLHNLNREELIYQISWWKCFYVMQLLHFFNWSCPLEYHSGHQIV